MDLFSREELGELAQMRDSICVSIFMPTYRVESELAQNPIRLKNALRDARTRLKEAGCREQDIDALLEPASALLGDANFWLGMSDGLAVFLTQNAARFYRLPVQFEELLVHGQHFHVKPLFPLIADNNRFYLLALAQHHVKLYQGTHFSISEVDAKQIPESMSEALWYDDAESSSRPLRGGNGGARAFGRGIHQSHGQDVEDVVSQPHDQLYRFFQQIDAGVCEALHDETAPLVLAGVEYYLPIYRDVNTYASLIDHTIIHGSPERVNPKELHEKAWAVLEPLFHKGQDEALARFEQVYNQDRSMASSDLKEIIPAAMFSRVDTLFLSGRQHVWGIYNAGNNKVEIHEQRRHGDEDLLDLAALQTYLNGGTVHTLNNGEMPVEQPAAALFRYPADVKAS